MNKPTAVLYSLNPNTGKVVVEKFYGEDGMMEAEDIRTAVGKDFDCTAMGINKTTPTGKKAHKKWLERRMKRIGITNMPV